MLFGYLDTGEGVEGRGGEVKGEGFHFAIVSKEREKIPEPRIGIKSNSLLQAMSALFVKDGSNGNPLNWFFPLSLYLISAPLWRDSWGAGRQEGDGRAVGEGSRSTTSLHQVSIHQLMNHVKDSCFDNE